MRRLILAFAVLTSMPSSCLAWGELGHRVVADIASRHLTKQAAAEVQKLLGGDIGKMIEFAPWADAVIEDRPETYPWHMIQIPPSAVKYDRARDRPDDACLVEQIVKFSGLLSDRTLEHRWRAEALKFLIHFVGDIHMPLHATTVVNKDGKGAWVRIGATTDKLHLWWDSGFVDALGYRPDELADALVQNISRAEQVDWQQGTSADWANESFSIARGFLTLHGLLSTRWDQVTRDDPVTLPVSVFDDVTPVIAQRLKMAGVRLAWLINEVLK